MNIFPSGIDFTSKKGIGDFLANLMALAFDIIGVICLIFIVWGAIILITSAGNQEKMAKGKSALTWAIIGFIIVKGAGFIMTNFRDILIK